jgi:hypothetical protein
MIKNLSRKYCILTQVKLSIVSSDTQFRKKNRQFLFAGLIPKAKTINKISNSNFENADQVLKYVILRRLTSKLLFRIQQPADEESHVSKGSVCFFRFSSKLIFSADSHRRFFGRQVSIPLLENIFLSTIKLQWLR